MRKVALALLLALVPTLALAANLTAITVTRGVPTGGTGTVSTLDNLIGTAGSPTMSVQTVQGISSMTPFLTTTTLNAETTKVIGTVNQGTSPWVISGAVTGTFWQATQPVSGTFYQTTQPVSLATAPTTPVTGTFWQTTQPVSGTFYQATQPVSIASLPSGVVTQATAANLNMTEASAAATLAGVTGPIPPQTPSATTGIGSVSVDPCAYAQKLSAVIAITSATTTSLVAVSGTTSVYVCSFSFSASNVVTTANILSFEYGTSTNCTGTHALTGGYGTGSVLAASPTAYSSGNSGSTIFSAPSANGICAVTTIGGSGSFEGVLTYVQQ